MSIKTEVVPLMGVTSQRKIMRGLKISNMYNVALIQTEGSNENVITRAARMSRQTQKLINNDSDNR